MRKTLGKIKWEKGLVASDSSTITLSEKNLEHLPTAHKQVILYTQANKG